MSTSRQVLKDNVTDVNALATVIQPWLLFAVNFGSIFGLVVSKLRNSAATACLFRVYSSSGIELSHETIGSLAAPMIQNNTFSGRNFPSK